MNHAVRALCFASLVVAWTPQAGGRNAAMVTRAQDIIDDDSVDPGFAISQMGPAVSLPNHRSVSARSDWIQFNQDECGFLRRIEDARTMLGRTGYGDDGFVEEDEDDPAVAGEEMFGQWLSAHPGIAVVNGAIDHWCNEGDDKVADFDTSEIS